MNYFDLKKCLYPEIMKQLNMLTDYRIIEKYSFLYDRTYNIYIHYKHISSGCCSENDQIRLAFGISNYTKTITIGSFHGFEDRKYNFDDINTDDDIIKIADMIIKSTLDIIKMEQTNSYLFRLLDLCSCLKYPPKFCIDIDCTNTRKKHMIDDINNSLDEIKTLIENYQNPINYTDSAKVNSLSYQENSCSSLDFDILEQENTPCPDWVQKNTNLGSLGEIIAKKYLEQKYTDVKRVSLENSSYGYDLSADKDVFEVKTSTYNSVRFFLTSNELKVAHNLGDNYHLFYINVNKSTKQVTGFIIKNPIRTLEINYLYDPGLMNSNKIIVTPYIYSVELLESYVKNFDKINLINYI